MDISSSSKDKNCSLLRKMSCLDERVKVFICLCREERIGDARRTKQFALDLLTKRKVDHLKKENARADQVKNLKFEGTPRQK
jgi:hypothetical protein